MYYYDLYVKKKLHTLAFWVLVARIWRTLFASALTRPSSNFSGAVMPACARPRPRWLALLPSPPRPRPRACARSVVSFTRDTVVLASPQMHAY